MLDLIVWKYCFARFLDLTSCKKYCFDFELLSSSVIT